jgi:hypothetical protein
MATNRFSGVVDRRTQALGPTFERAIRTTQTAVWASVAGTEHDKQATNLRRQHASSSAARERFTLPAEGWWAISASRQALYLEGKRHPQKRMIDGVAKHAPLSRDAFYSSLWPMLSPQTDLNACTRTVVMFGKPKLDTLVNGLLTGRAWEVSTCLEDLNATAALVAQIRLSVNDGELNDAFDTGCALAQALCYHSVNPLFASKATALWDLVSQGVLEGLRNGGFQFSRCREGFEHFSNVLRTRLGDAKWHYGIHRLVSGPELRWSTIVDLNQECIRGFATPELDRHDSLQSFLDADKSARPRTADTLDKDPLFIPAKR